MTQNPYDQASRFQAKLEPIELLAWLLQISSSGFLFRRWLDTRSTAFPGEDDRISDLVAHLEELASGGIPWALLLEFQANPDPLMFGRVLQYLGKLWTDHKPDEEAGSRFHVGAIVVNLTGIGSTSREMHWPGTRLFTHLGVAEWNLEEENADELLVALEAGHRSLCLLPWVALMQGGDDPTTVERWIRLAEREPNTQRRSSYAALAQVFAEKAQRKDLWAEKLKGWNVEESTVLNELMERTTKFKKAMESSEAKASRLLVLRLGTKKFGSGPTESERALLDAITDPARFAELNDRILDVNSWADLLTNA